MELLKIVKSSFSDGHPVGRKEKDLPRSEIYLPLRSTAVKKLLNNATTSFSEATRDNVVYEL